MHHLDELPGPGGSAVQEALFGFDRLPGAAGRPVRGLHPGAIAAKIGARDRAVMPTTARLTVIRASIVR